MFKLTKILVLTLMSLFCFSFIQNSARAADDKPEVYLYSHNQYSKVGLISQLVSEEPVLNIQSRNHFEDVQIDIFKSDMDLLLKFLLHDHEFNQINTKFDTDHLEKIASLNMKIKDDSDQFSLPQEEAGIYLIKISYAQKTDYNFLVRSNIAGIVKETKNDWIYWVQNVKDHRSLKGVTVKNYNLENSVKLISQSVTDNQGIARTLINDQADIAVLEKQGSKTIIPLNLIRLNSDYANKSFTKDKKETVFYIFTDRPLYKPGDEMFFKVIARDELDCSFSIPSKKARVKISKGYGRDREIIFEKEYSISDSGSFDDKMKIPEELKTGKYTLTVTTTDQDEQNSWTFINYNYYNELTFAIEHYRKPEYTLDIQTDQDEIIAGEPLKVSLGAQYFSGQPVRGQTINYKVKLKDYRKGFYNNYAPYYDQDDPNYSGNLKLDEKGQSRFTLDTTRLNNEGEIKIYEIEASFSDQSGNSVFAKKNILVYPGTFKITRINDQNYKSSILINNPINLNLKLEPIIKNVEISARIKRKFWQDRQYREEILETIKTVSDQNGVATLNYTPNQQGRYIFEITAFDSKQNLIKKEVNFWVFDNQNYFNSNNEKNNLSLISLKESYKPGQKALLRISTSQPNRDVFITTQRDFVHSYKVLRLNQINQEFTIPLDEKDIPNITFNAQTFNRKNIESVTAEALVDASSKKINVDLKTDKEEYRAGEEVKVDILTTDQNNKPVSAETALWAVDKSIFELVRGDIPSVFDYFWSEKNGYESTDTSHSLRSISMSPAEMGCFDKDTLVLMGDGKQKKIKNIKKGDFILTKENIFNKKLVKAEVKDTFQSTINGYLIINNRIKITPDHILFVNGNWKTADKIKINDTLIDKNNQQQKVETLEFVKEKAIFHNLEIEKKHTFFANNIWVHNEKGGISSPDLRSAFEDTAYWNPKIQTNSNGEAQITFTVPDNLTTWVISAISADPNTKVGSSKSEITVSQDVVIRPVLPNILRNEETVFVSALVHNFTDQDQKFEVSLKFDAGEVYDNIQTIKVPSRDFKQLFFKVKTTRAKPEAKFIFKAVSSTQGQTGDAIEKEIEVKEFGYWQNSAQNLKGPGQYNILINSDSRNEKSRSVLKIYPSYLGSMEESMDYLIDYPYGCIEQTTSRLVPLVITKENPQIFKRINQQNDIDDMINQGLSRLEKLQNQDGGWGWWNTYSSDPFITAYVLQYLIRIDQLGYNVNDNFLNRVKKYFENFKNQESSSDLEQRKAKIAVVYALSLFDSESEQRKVHLRDFKNLNADFIALASLANLNNNYNDPNNNGINQLKQMVIEKKDIAYFQGGDEANFGSDYASTGLALKALAKADPHNRLNQKIVKYLIDQKNSYYWYNSFATANIMQGFIDYYKAKDFDSLDYKYSVKLDDETIFKGKITSFEQIEEIDIPLEKIKKQGSKLSLNQIGDGQLLSTYILKEYRTSKNLDAGIQGDLQIQRTYKNLSSPGKPIAVGDKVMILLQINNKSPFNQYAIIEDHLPAGLVPINENLKQENQSHERSMIRSNSIRYKQDGVVIPIGNFNALKRSYSYNARVISAGEFFAPPAKFEFMYHPRYFAQSNIDKISVMQDQEAEGFPSDKNQFKKALNLKKWQDSGRVLSKIIIAFLFIGLIIFIIYEKKFRRTPKTSGKKEKK